MIFGIGKIRRYRRMIQPPKFKPRNHLKLSPLLDQHKTCASSRIRVFLPNRRQAVCNQSTTTNRLANLNNLSSTWPKWHQKDLPYHKRGPYLPIWRVFRQHLWQPDQSTLTTSRPYTPKDTATLKNILCSTNQCIHKNQGYRKDHPFWIKVRLSTRLWGSQGQSSNFNLWLDSSPNLWPYLSNGLSL